MDKYVFQQGYKITRSDRALRNSHKPLLIWFTGLSGSGKSTLANQLELELFKRKISTYTLDGDNVRLGLNKDLGFTQEDRQENIRRISEVANLMIDAGLVVLAAFVSPYKKDRKNIREVVKDINFVEVFVDAPLEECERRDVKGLYKKARNGKIENFTGISAPYEAPDDPDVVIRTDKFSVKESVDILLNYLIPKLKSSNG